MMSNHIKWQEADECKTVADVTKALGTYIEKDDTKSALRLFPVDTIKHVLDNSQKYDYVVLLQATSPLRNHKHIDKAIQLLEEKNADAIISVRETRHNPLWSNTLDDSLSMKGFQTKDILSKRSQDLEKYYELNGAIYICKVTKLLEEKGFFLRDNIYAFKMDRESSIDIDEKIDFKIAEALIENN